MDKTYDYHSIAASLDSNLNPVLLKQIKDLRETLVAELEPENETALSGKAVVPEEVLRKYISITREIRAFWFDNVDTHLLTIEHLAEMILGKRKAYEKARKGESKGILNLKPNDTGANGGKAVISKPSVDKIKDVLSDIAKLSPEELLKVLASIGKK